MNSRELKCNFIGSQTTHSGTKTNTKSITFTRTKNKTNDSSSYT